MAFILHVAHQGGSRQGCAGGQGQRRVNGSIIQRRDLKW
jgi:hypothetical protein